MAGASVCFAAPLGEGEDSSWAGAYEAALEKHKVVPHSKGGRPREPREPAKMEKIRRDVCTICGYEGNQPPGKAWRSAPVVPDTPLRAKKKKGGICVVCNSCGTANGKVRRGAPFFVSNVFHHSIGCRTYSIGCVPPSRHRAVCAPPFQVIATAKAGHASASGARSASQKKAEAATATRASSRRPPGGTLSYLPAAPSTETAAAAASAMAVESADDDIGGSAGAAASSSSPSSSSESAANDAVIDGLAARLVALYDDDDGDEDAAAAAAADAARALADDDDEGPEWAGVPRVVRDAEAELRRRGWVSRGVRVCNLPPKDAQLYATLRLRQVKGSRTEVSVLSYVAHKDLDRIWSLNH